MNQAGGTKPASHRKRALLRWRRAPSAKASGLGLRGPPIPPTDLQAAHDVQDQTTRRHSNPARWVPLGIVVAVTLIAVGLIAVGLIAVFGTSGGNSRHSSAPRTHTVVYSVSSSLQGAGVLYQYGPGKHDSANLLAVRVPWTKTITPPGNDFFLYVNATVGFGAHRNSWVSCTITEDGRQIASNTSRGANALVECSP